MSQPTYINDSFPFVELVQQEAISVESTSVNGRQQDVYVVVKNQPFNIKLRAVNNGASTINFQNTTVQAKLFYDCDPPKAVDFIKDEPLQYMGTVNNTGSEIVVEVKLAILSSQHQGSLFLVMLRINNNNSESICVLSHPIRIVSKIDHIRKEGVPIKKKTFNEILTDRLRDLEALQEEQVNIIKNLYEIKHLPFEGIKSEPEDDVPVSPSKKAKKSRSADPKDIQQCFNKVVSTFKAMSEEERISEIKLIVHEVKQEDLGHVVEAFGSDLRDFKPARKDAMDDCTCHSCPARKEVENYNTFYSNFLSLSAELRSPKASAASQIAYVNQLMCSASILAQSPALSCKTSPPVHVPTPVPQASMAASSASILSPQMTTFLNQVMRLQQQQILLQQQNPQQQQQQQGLNVAQSIEQPPGHNQTVTLQQVAPQFTQLSPKQHISQSQIPPTQLSPPQLPTPQLSPTNLSPQSTTLLDQLVSSPTPLTLQPTRSLPPPKESCEIRLEPLEALAEAPKW